MTQTQPEFLELGSFKGHNYLIGQSSGIVYQNSILRQLTEEEFKKLPEYMHRSINSIRRASDNLGYGK